jgi:hypothetical protein
MQTKEEKHSKQSSKKKGSLQEKHRPIEFHPNESIEAHPNVSAEKEEGCFTYQNTGEHDAKGRKLEPKSEIRVTPSLAYSLGGLLLGLGCIIGGIVLFLRGVTGSTSWTAKFSELVLLSLMQLPASFYS